ncbi:MAG: aminodeoxychorismate lyase [Neisseriaceae bacterium]|nr:aminodeoxychorismate lyase [Neisseriaceae bacterium]
MTDAFSTEDRGLLYGDGIFRTFVAQVGQPRHWEKQYQILKHDAQRLMLTVPSSETLLSEIKQLTANDVRAIVKILVTRGLGERGYVRPKNPQPVHIVYAQASPSPVDYCQIGIHLFDCETTWGAQPLFAGIKHLNRLENVWARSEWENSPEVYQEGIVKNSQGAVISGTMSNLFIVKDNAILTPSLSESGVAGAMRSLLLEATLPWPVCIQSLSQADLLAADAVFLSNSVFGIWPVARYQTQTWQDFSVAQSASDYLHAIVG